MVSFSRVLYCSYTQLHTMVQETVASNFELILLLALGLQSILLVSIDGTQFTSANAKRLSIMIHLLVSSILLYAYGTIEYACKFASVTLSIPLSSFVLEYLQTRVTALETKQR